LWCGVVFFFFFPQLVRKMGVGGGGGELLEVKCVFFGFVFFYNVCLKYISFVEEFSEILS